MPKPSPLTLTPAVRAQLERLAAGKGVSALRAQIILALAAGTLRGDIVDNLRTSNVTIIETEAAYLALGLSAITRPLRPLSQQFKAQLQQLIADPHARTPTGEKWTAAAVALHFGCSRAVARELFPRGRHLGARVPDPTPEEIAERCAAIQSEWGHLERVRRASGLDQKNGGNARQLLEYQPRIVRVRTKDGRRLRTR